MTYGSSLKHWGQHMGEFNFLRSEWYAYQDRKRKEYWDNKLAWEKKQPDCPKCKARNSIRRQHWGGDDSVPGGDETGVEEYCNKYCGYRKELVH